MAAVCVSHLIWPQLGGLSVPPETTADLKTLQTCSWRRDIKGPHHTHALQGPQKGPSDSRFRPC